MIDTDLERNITHVKPYLGVLLVGSIALLFGMLIYKATNNLTQNIHTKTPAGVEGTLVLKTKGVIEYGDTIQYKSSASGINSQESTTYITTVCFQGETLVYQKSVLQGVSVYLYDQIGSGLDWDGKNATCSATLMYREVKRDVVDVYVVDSVSFEVIGRGY
jgi:hypothetical protein